MSSNINLQIKFNMVPATKEDFVQTSTMGYQNTKLVLPYFPRETSNIRVVITFEAKSKSK